MENKLVRYCIYCGEIYTAPNADTFYCYKCYMDGTAAKAAAVQPVVQQQPLFSEGWEDRADILDLLFCNTPEQKQMAKDEEEESAAGGKAFLIGSHIARLFF